MAPLVKTGGLGDVLSSLPQAMADLGHEVRVCLPYYAAINNQKAHIKSTGIKGEVKIGKFSKLYEILQIQMDNTSFEIHLIDNKDYFGRIGLYANGKTGKVFHDNDERFSFFCRAMLDYLKKSNWRPDIIHAHDWQTALLPVYINTIEKNQAQFKNTRTVLTIHNMSYQGKFDKNRYPLLGLPVELIYATNQLEYYDESNFLKGGISFADKITTVSEAYAREIQRALGCGLEGVLRERTKDVVGILNGVDYSIWSPSSDKNIPHRYNISNLSGKRKNKVELLNRSKLPIHEGTPLIGMVGRLVEQKGLRLVIEGSEELFEMNLQLIILGTGDKAIEQELKKLELRHGRRLKVYLKFDEKLAHEIEAGADIFLMPSLFEPCGLNQMYSLKYGTPPIVHKVGGLADTVSEFEESTGIGTGFVFEDFSVEAMIQSIGRAVRLYSKKRKWTKLMKNGMKQDFSWNKSAEKYSQLFASLVGN